MNQAERLKHIREHLGLSQQAFADSIESKQGKIRDIEIGKQKIPQEIALIIEKIHNISFKWLLTGEGEMLIANNEYNSSAYLIPFRATITAAAGHGCYVYNEEPTEYISVPTKIIKEIGADPKNSDFIQVLGDSMQPALFQNDKILVDRSKTSILDNKIYVLRLEDRLLVKRIQKIKRDEIVLISDNKDFYPPIPINIKEDDITLCGRVLWMMRELA